MRWQLAAVVAALGVWTPGTSALIAAPSQPLARSPPLVPGLRGWEASPRHRVPALSVIADDAEITGKDQLHFSLSMLAVVYLLGVDAFSGHASPWNNFKAVWSARKGAVLRQISALCATVSRHPMAKDVASASCLYALGKFTSALISGEEQDVGWLVNWAMIGIVDGMLTSSWYLFIQRIADHSPWGLGPTTFLMMLSSSFLYTPVYCVYFLILISLLEGKGWRGACARVRCDTLAMLWKATKVWGPVNLLLFGFVPLHLRTVVSMSIHYIFLVSLALWDAAAAARREADSDLCSYASSQDVEDSDAESSQSRSSSWSSES